jgi:hypothetical protein
MLLFLLLPSSDVNDGRDQVDARREKACGPLKADFSDPCNAVLMPLLHI